MHNSQLGPGRTADWADGVVGKVYDSLAVYPHAECTALVYAYISVYPIWEVVGVTDCQNECVSRVRICPASIVF